MKGLLRTGWIACIMLGTALPSWSQNQDSLVAPLDTLRLDRSTDMSALTQAPDTLTHQEWQAVSDSLEATIAALRTQHVIDSLENIILQQNDLLSHGLPFSILEEEGNEENAATDDEPSAETNLSLQKIREESTVDGWLDWVKRIGLTLLLLFAGSVGFRRLRSWLGGYIDRLRNRAPGFLREVRYFDYTFLSIAQLHGALIRGALVLRALVLMAFLYAMLTLLFQIFPSSRYLAEGLFNLVKQPVAKGFRSFWNYLPNLAIIVLAIWVFIQLRKAVKFFFQEIKDEHLKIPGFYKDWAMPTSSLIIFVLYIFLAVLIFPYLPGSDSTAFQGISIFLGVLVSLGSSSAIANVMAGLVITYMRPFQVGHRIKIGDTIGDIMEKTLLITRVRTIKNEVVTIPNAMVLQNATVNYSAEEAERGLIVHSTVTIGYDIEQTEIESALIESAKRTQHLLDSPSPFVLRTSLDDFYVSYQINAYTANANLQADIQSALHGHILDVCKERDIEIMSPHYRAMRDGNASTIPGFDQNAQQKPSFEVTIKGEQQNRG